MTRNRIEAVIGIAAVLALGVLAIVLWNNKVLVVAGLFDDMFMPWDAGTRWAHGQMSSRDFPSSLGPMYYLFQGLGNLAANGGANAVLKADVIALAVTMPVMICVLFTRLPALVAGATTLMLGTWMISPAQADFGSKWLTHLASYNRQGFVWAVLVAFLSAIGPKLVPGHSPRRRQLAIAIEGALVGYLLVLMVLTKISFAVPIGLFFGLATLIRYKARVAPVGVAFGSALVVLVAGLGTAEFAAPGFTLAYLSDLLYAGSAQSAGLLRAKAGNRGDALTYIGTEGIASLVAVTAILGRLGVHRRLVVGAWAAGAMVLIGLSLVQIHDLYAPWFAFGAVFVFALARSTIEESLSAGEYAVLRLVVLPSLAMATSLSVMGVVEHTLYARRVARHPDQFLGFPDRRLAYSSGDLPLPAMSEPELVLNSSLGGVVKGTVPVAEWTASGTYGPLEAYLLWTDARKLGAQLGITPATRVLALGFANGAPAMLHATPPEKLLPWRDPGRSFAITRPPKGALDDVDLILVPRADRFGYAAAMRTAYAATIDTQFAPAGQSVLWTAWRRRQPGLTRR